MNDDSLSGLLVILVLIITHAMLVIAHAALLNARKNNMRELALEGDKKARQIIELISSPNLTITHQLLTLLLRFAIAAVGLMMLAEPMLDTTSTTQTVLVYGGVLFVVGCITLILGDLVPEAIGSTYARSLTYPAARFMRLLMTVSSPVVIVILSISQILSRLFNSSQLVNIITEEEIMSMIDAGHTGGSIEEEEKDMIYSVLQLDQTRVSEVMVPRIDIVAVEINDSIEDAGNKFIESGYSRIPVFDEHIDNVRGLLYAKDLLAYWNNTPRVTKSITDMMRPAYFVPENKYVDELLKEIQTQKVHLAIVVDEYGGTAGLVTIENIIEEIIGDIQDEYDVNEEAEYIQLDTDEYRVDASIDLDDFNDMLDVDLPTEDSDTLGGYLYTHFGRVPLVGEVIDDEKLTMTVQSVDGRRIRKIHIIRKRVVDPDDDNGNNDDNLAVVETPSEEPQHDD